MKTVKDERKAIDRKKCFPNKRVEEMFWAYADEILDIDKDVKHRDIYAMLETAFKEGYKKGFASAESYHSDKELYQEILEEWDQMVKNDSYEDLYGSKKVEEVKKLDKEENFCEGDMRDHFTKAQISKGEDE